ncbi:hypothetical protein ACTXT7_015306 [Hymenolepis weldensis]
MEQLSETACIDAISLSVKENEEKETLPFTVLKDYNPFSNIKPEKDAPHLSAFRDLSPSTTPNTATVSGSSDGKENGTLPESDIDIHEYILK